MHQNKISSLLKYILLLAVIMSLSACFHDDDDDDNMMSSMASYEVTVTNATHNQPLTPVAIIVHYSDYHPWNTGSAASTGLEMLAESGDPSQFVADADMDIDVVATASSTAGPFGPGNSQTVTIEVTPTSGMLLSVATMLANTNDAFTGAQGISLDGLGVGDSTSALARVYDAGTEDNTESAATIPGPAGGGMGEGFNAARSINDFVTIHPGVVTFDDGLTGSALDESHRWLGPAAKVSVTRVQ